MHIYLYFQAGRKLTVRQLLRVFFFLDTKDVGGVQQGISISDSVWDWKAALVSWKREMGCREEAQPSADSPTGPCPFQISNCCYCLCFVYWCFVFFIFAYQRGLPFQRFSSAPWGYLFADISFMFNCKIFSSPSLHVAAHKMSRKRYQILTFKGSAGPVLKVLTNTLLCREVVRAFMDEWLARR